MPPVWLTALAIALGTDGVAHDAVFEGPEVGVSARFEFEHAAMGTRFRIVLIGIDGDRARLAARRAFRRVDAIEDALSDYRAGSELRRLEASDVGVPTPVSVELRTVFAEAREIGDGTDGAFDITVGALTRLWRWAERRGIDPPADQFEAAVASTGPDGFSVAPEHGTVTLHRVGVRFDVGGIAKGYAVDEAFESVRGDGFESALVDGGGDLRVGSAPPGTAGWAVSVPEGDGIGRRGSARWKRVFVSDVAIATSGATYRTLGEDRRSHILDPRTGLGVRGDRIVTVHARSAARADALASALGVLGEAGLDRVRALGALHAVVIEPQDGSNSHGGAR